MALLDSCDLYVSVVDATVWILLDVCALSWLRGQPEAAATRLSEIATKAQDHSEDMPPRCDTAE
jgi:hypothetical protein